MVYQFTVDDFPVTADQKKFITGVQANIWSETMPTIKRLDFMLFPRISALAEAAWSQPASRNYPDYLNRLKPNLNGMLRMGFIIMIHSIRVCIPNRSVLANPSGTRVCVMFSVVLPVWCRFVFGNVMEISP